MWPTILLHRAPIADVLPTRREKPRRASADAEGQVPHIA